MRWNPGIVAAWALLLVSGLSLLVAWSSTDSPARDIVVIVAAITIPPASWVAGYGVGRAHPRGHE